MLIRLCLFILLFLNAPSAFAEYRVFLLKIYPVDAESSENTDTDFRLVESTLDPLQYRQYFQVAANEAVVYIDTWMCYGRTDQFKKFCPNPKGQNEVEEDELP